MPKREAESELPGDDIAKFEPIHLIFYVLIKVYNEIHNLLLAMSVS